MTHPLKGRCHEMALAAAREDPTLTVVFGHYTDPHSGREGHWWCVRPDGSIYDPSAAQFASGGSGIYEAHQGPLLCVSCGAVAAVEVCMQTGRPVCSEKCLAAFLEALKSRGGEGVVTNTNNPLSDQELDWLDEEIDKYFDYQWEQELG